MKISVLLQSAILLAEQAFAESLTKRAYSNPKTPPVTVKGNAFFAGNKRFYLRGVDYQPGGSSPPKDPMADMAAFKQHVLEFQKLEINAIRIYTIDNSPNMNHDEGMKLLADAGIYVALDINNPLYSLNRKDEKAIQASYNEVYLQSIFATIDIFAKYDNTLLFFSANEVMNAVNMTWCAPYIKSVTRDVKQYISQRGYRDIPVGYAAVNLPEIDLLSADYFNCGAESAQSDFWAVNDYSFCNSDFVVSGWDKRVANYTDYSKPIFLSEFGCIDSRPRRWPEIKSLYSKNMTSVYSGGLVYEFTEEPNHYGLVKINGDQSVKELHEFAPLQQVFKDVPIPTDDGGYRENIPQKSCPPKDTTFWKVEGEAIPDTPAGAEKFMQNGAGPGPGLGKDGKGSQWAGTASKTWSVPGGSKSNQDRSRKPSAGTNTRPSRIILALSGMAVLVHLARTLVEL